MLTNISKLALSIILLMCVGCSPSARETANTPSQNAVNPAAPTAKLRIQKEKDGTGVYQSEFFLRSQFFVAGKPVIGQHKGELWNTASYKGDKAKCVLENLAIMIKHSKPERSGWQFPKSAKILFIADGIEVKPVKVVQQDLELEDGEYWESLITQPPCEAVSNFAKATTAEIRIGDASIGLTAGDIASFRALATAIGL